ARHGGDGGGDNQARLEPGREVALAPGGLEAREIDPRRKGKAGDQVGLLVKGQGEDRRPGVDREQGDREEPEIGAEPLDAPGGQVRSPRSPTRSTMPARTKIV